MRKNIYSLFIVALALITITFILKMTPPSSGIAAAYYNPGFTSSSSFEANLGTGSSGQVLTMSAGLAQWVTPTLAPTMSFNNTATHPIQTVAASANGFQLSTTRNVSVFYSVNINTTATIGGASDGYVVLEICATNSATASAWQEVSRTRNGQTISLAITLNSVQNIGGELMNIVPAGYYVRLRSVNTSGTPVFTYISGQEATI